MTATHATEGQLFIQDAFVGSAEYILVSPEPHDKQREERHITLAPSGHEFSGTFTYSKEEDWEGWVNWSKFPRKEQPCNLTVEYGLWFSPIVLLFDAFVESIEYTPSDGSDQAVVNFTGGGSFITFARWWHRPIWWLYTRWARVKKRLGK